jgi:hypothetical protein
VGILLFLLKLRARRQINYVLRQEQVLTHVNRLVKGQNETVCHGDTLEKVLQWMPWPALAHVRTDLVRLLVRKKVLQNQRLLDQFYMVAVDATGVVTFNERHCPKCLWKTSGTTGKTLYYHPVLEAKLITSAGFAFSLETEFIENPVMEKVDKGKDRLKQDCELKAFYRLAEKLKKSFPQLNVCLVLDGLYAAKPVFDVAEALNWKYIITFKKGSMPSTYQEFLALVKLQEENRARHYLEKRSQSFQWASEMNHQGRLLQGILCKETLVGGQSKTFAWITNLKVSKKNVIAIANNGGRCRWKIENQGFNMQKNGGYNLEHAYSKNENAGKCYYLLLQIAHTINQLIEKGSLLKKLGQAHGSIKNIAFLLLEALRTNPISAHEYEAIRKETFQIRLDTS